MDALVAAGGAAIRRGSQSFAAASRLFAPSVRESAWLLYAWCRHCDDAIDGQQSGHGRSALTAAERRARLDDLYAATRRVLDGHEADSPVFAALQRVVRTHDIPPRHPLDLLDGFAMDVEGRRYETLPETLSYCYHVAGVVGVMMAHVMGARDEGTLDRACDLGIALQLTNIARDIVDDALAGRVYVPRQWLDGAGVPPRDLHLPRHRAALAILARRLMETAEPYYTSGRAGLSDLPFRSAWAAAAALEIYRDIGRLVVRREERAWERRTVVGRARKLARVAGAFARALEARTLGRRRPAPGRDALWTRRR